MKIRRNCKTKNVKQKLKITNFEFVYKYECLPNLAIAIMSADVCKEYFSICDHPIFITDSKDKSIFNPFSLVKSMIYQIILSDKKQKYKSFDLFFKYSDYSPSLIIDLYENGQKNDDDDKNEQKDDEESKPGEILVKESENPSLATFWDFFWYSCKEMEKRTKDLEGNSTVKTNYINETYDPVRIVDSIDDVNDFLNPKKYLETKRKEMEGKKGKEKKKLQEEVRKIIFSKPVFFYLFLFKNLHYGNVKWEEIYQESKEPGTNCRSSYILTSVLFYHKEHYKVLIIHDTPVLIAPEGNKNNPDLPESNEVMIIALTYSHVEIDQSANEKFYYLHQYALSSRKPQAEKWELDYLSTIKSYFKENENANGLDLINILIRFPAFYFYITENKVFSEKICDIIRFDIYNKKVDDFDINFIIKKHSPIPLWAESIAKFLESFNDTQYLDKGDKFNKKADTQYLRRSIHYITNIPFIIAFTVDVYKAYKESIKNSQDIDQTEINLLNQAFNITFKEKGKSEEKKGKNETNYNDIFISLEDSKAEREDIIYNLNKQALKFMKKRIENYGTNEDIIKNYVAKVNRNDLEITQDFLDYQGAKGRTHPYMKNQ